MFIHIVALLDGANVQKISISGKFKALKTQLKDKITIGGLLFAHQHVAKSNSSLMSRLAQIRKLAWR
jgi:hypothetical protein